MTKSEIKSEIKHLEQRLERLIDSSLEGYEYDKMFNEIMSKISELEKELI
jgi:hypothetical protein